MPAVALILAGVFCRVEYVRRYNADSAGAEKIALVREKNLACSGGLEINLVAVVVVVIVHIPMLAVFDKAELEILCRLKYRRVHDRPSFASYNDYSVFFC